LSSRMLKNSRDRLLTRVARNRAHAFAIICPTGPFFQHPVKRVLIVTATTGYQTRSFFEAAKRAEVAAVAGIVGLGDHTAYIALPAREQFALV